MSGARIFATPHPRWSIALSLAVTALGCALVTDSFTLEGAPWLIALLIVLAAVGDVWDVRFDSLLRMTPIDVVAQITAVLISPVAAVIVGGGATILSYLVHHGIARTRWAGDGGYSTPAVALNVASNTFPVVVGALAVDAAGLSDSHGAELVLAAVLLAVTASALAIPNFSLIQGLRTGQSVRRLFLETVVELRQTTLAQVLLVVMVSALYDSEEEIGLLVAGIALWGFLYLGRLVVVSRDQTVLADKRADELSQLSWGVLSTLVRTLNRRDPESGRHSAAVARFSRDIARHMGMDERDQALAHISGLLHDIGRFVQPDVLLSAQVSLVDMQDVDAWRRVREHPEIGERLLRDFTSYGPLSLIVGQHHERFDGRGYPRKLKGEEIHPIARIVAVAEVYDTITAETSYRTTKTGLEALIEMRRCAGTQFDPEVVEALALTLQGTSSEYRAAGDADHLHELEFQRELLQVPGDL